MRRHRTSLNILGLLMVAAPLANGAKVGGSLFSGGEVARLGTVKRADLLRQVTVAGTVVPARRTVFTPPYNSYVRKLYVKLGDPVKAGDPIVSLAQSLRGEAET